MAARQFLRGSSANLTEPAYGWPFQLSKPGRVAEWQTLGT